MKTELENFIEWIQGLFLGFVTRVKFKIYWSIKKQKLNFMSNGFPKFNCFEKAKAGGAILNFSSTELSNENER